MAEPRTIDNLGVETSVRWAFDQEAIDKSILQESPAVSRQATVDVYQPFYKSEFDLLFQIKQRYQQWAAFAPPSGFTTQRMRLFVHQIIPSLGSEEFQLAQMQKIRDRIKSNQNRRKDKGARTSEYGWEEEREEEEENKESKTLLDLLEYIGTLDKLLIAINSRRSQYSKG